MMSSAFGQHKSTIKPDTFREYITRVQYMTGCDMKLSVEEEDGQYVYSIDARGPFAAMYDMCRGTKHVIRWTY